MEKQFQYRQEKWCRYDWKEKIIKNQKNKNEFKYHMMFKNVIRKIRKIKKNYHIQCDGKTIQC